MEKLQKAIAQARETRQQSTQTQTRQPNTGGGQPPTVSGWDTLPTMNVDARQLRRKHVLSHESSQSAMPFDVMRTKIMQMMRQNDWKRLLITSPTPQCGKTTLSANLAFGLARQGESSAILMEFDLRRPGLSALLGQTPQEDIRAMLRGEVAFEEQAVRIGNRVALSLAKSRSDDPTRILTSTRTVEKLQTIEETYQPDFMIFDTPPLLVNDDTRSLLPMVDCVVLVARAEVSTSTQIDLCEREIASHTNMLGVVLNQCHFEDENSKYGYNYY